MWSHHNNCATFAIEVGMSNSIYEYDLMFFFCKLNNIIAVNVLSLELYAVSICRTQLDKEASKCQLFW